MGSANICLSPRRLHNSGVALAPTLAGQWHGQAEPCPMARLAVDGKRGTESFGALAQGVERGGPLQAIRGDANAIVRDGQTEFASRHFDLDVHLCRPGMAYDIVQGLAEK